MMIMLMIFYSMKMFMIFMSYVLDSLFLIWIMLEISSMSFCIILNYYSKKQYSIFYFMISSISSIIILLSIFFNKIIILSLINPLILFVLWFKLSMYPFNTWMNFMIKDLKYIMLIPLLTVMKFIPMMIFFKYINLNILILALLILSSFMSMSMTFSTSYFPMLLNFSSMYNLPIILILSSMDLNMLNWYTFMYMISTIFMMIILNKLNIYNKNSLNLNLTNNKEKYLFNFVMFMHSQLPPFTLFIMKWNVIELLIEVNKNMLFFFMLIILTSLSMSFNYLNFNNYTYFLINFKMNHNSIMYKNSMYTMIYAFMIMFFLSYTFQVMD